jgi:molybdopterin converting factor small subunit
MKSQGEARVSEMTKARVTVEFYGVPRRRAGLATLRVEAATVAEALRQVEAACPELRLFVPPDAGLDKHYTVSLNGNTFLTDLRHELRNEDHLLLLSKDAGG